MLVDNLTNGKAMSASPEALIVAVFETLFPDRLLKACSPRRSEIA